MAADRETQPLQASEGIDRQTLLRNALTAIDRLQARLDEAELRRSEPLAVVGIGCRFPGGGHDPNTFWSLLSNGVDAVCEVPPNRWNVDALYDPNVGVPGKTMSRWGGFLDRIDTLDAAFFGLTPREATLLDPQQRLLLEVAWEALEDAGQPPLDLRGTETGVFVGITLTEYLTRNLLLLEPTEIDAYLGTGNALNAAAGRLSYLLGVHGPSMAIDTACSSSLVALHVASGALRAGDCDIALVGGVNALVAQETYIGFSRWGMMSPDGRCKTFDASANGFVRGEGCGVLVLKRLSDAMDAGDRIRGLIRGSAVNQDGPSSGLTVPNGLAQEAVIRKALVNAGVEPADVTYVEAHGTGTSLGDPIEIEALASAYGPRPAPLEIGSVKTNLGHLESASGMAGLIKTLLAIEHAQLPPHLHLKDPTPHVDWENLPIEVPTGLRPWKTHDGQRIAGVSAFGFSGTNAHVIVEAAPRPTPAEHSAPERGLQLLTLSARDETALQALARSHSELLADPGGPSLPDVARMAAVGRSHFGHRLALVASSREDASSRLAAWASGTPSPGLWHGSKRTGAPRVAFLFTGQGSQYPDMGRQLYDREPVFRKALDECHEALRGHLDRPLRSVMFPEAGDEGLIDQTAYTQPALFALEYAMAELWRSWGVEPALVLGHSIGEYAAACVAGVFPFDQAIRLVAARGRLMQDLPSGGSMYAVQADEKEVQACIGPLSSTVAVAAINGPGSLVLSGPAGDLERARIALEQRGVKVRPLTVSHAFHSPLMDPILDAFEREAEGITYATPRIPLVANLTGRLARGDDCTSARYWRRHAREPVQFQRAIETVAELGIQAALEVGPSPTLSGLGSQCWSSDEPMAWFPSLRKDKDDTHQVLEALGGLFVAGVDPDWAGFYRDRPGRHVSLPTYPFQRKRFWIDAPPGGVRKPGASRSAEEPDLHPILGTRLRSPSLSDVVFETSVSREHPSYLEHHRIHGNVVLPATTYLELAVQAAEAGLGFHEPVLEDVTFERALVVPGPGAVTIQCVLRPDGGGGATFTIFSASPTGNGVDAEAPDWRSHASGSIRNAREETAPAGDADLKAATDRCTDRRDIDAFYAGLERRGLQFGDVFRGLLRLHSGDHESVGRIKLDEAVGSPDDYRIHPALLDAALQALVATWPADEARDDATYLPLGIERYAVHGRLGTDAWSHATTRPDSTDETRLGDVDVFDRDGRLVAEVRGFRARRVEADVVARAAADPWRDWIYRKVWEPAVLQREQPPGRTGRWLVVGESDALPTALADGLRRRAELCELVRWSSGCEDPDASQPCVDDTPPADLARLLTQRVQEPTDIVVVTGEPGHSVLHETSGARAAEDEGYRKVLQLAQALLSVSWPEGPPRLWIVTLGLYRVGPFPGTPDPWQAPVAGLAQVLSVEHPELRCTRIDLDPLEPDLESTVAEITGRGPDPEVAFRGGQRFRATLERGARRPDGLDPATAASVRLKNTTPGVLEGVVLQSAPQPEPDPEEIIIRVHASALNFRDVLNALGMYPGPPQPLGAECAGVVVAVGSAVEDLAPGDAVMGIARGCHGTFAVTHHQLVVRKPAALSFAEATTIPNAFLTARYALGEVAGMNAGDRVLIHAAAGGVGMAAVQLALRAGATVFGTAGSDRKRTLLKAMGVHHVMDSRSLEFAETVRKVTGGEGVHIVLNSLADELARASLSVLAPRGRFVELGKRGILPVEQVAEERPDAAYSVIDLQRDCIEDPASVGSILQWTMDELERGSIRPLPFETFPLDQAQAAFRHMAQAKHVGKVVLTQSVVPGTPGSRVGRAAGASPAVSGTYLITGGLSGLGLATAQWLAREGATGLALIARSTPSEAAREAIRAMEAAGVPILAIEADVSRTEDVAAALERVSEELPPLVGIVHCAAVYEDAALVQQSATQFTRVSAPKVRGAWNLHTLTRSMGLEQFVLFSSASTLLGSRGQASYVASNAFLDALAHHRRARGLPALSVSWGPWSDVGAVSDRNLEDRLSARGVGSMTPATGVAVLGQLMRQGESHVGVLPVDWPTFLSGRPDAAQSSYYRSVSSADAMPRGAPSGNGRAGFRLRLGAAPASRRRGLVRTFVQDRALRVMGIANTERIDPSQPLSQVGLDSLMAVELRNLLANDLEMPGRLPASLLFDHPTLGELTDHLVDLLDADPGRATAQRSEDGPTAPDHAAELRELSEDEASDLLRQELGLDPEDGP